ncbi:MAG: AbgT family transporter [Bacilli bacterium]|nr:AbgT family transporter [Bacilli bacterium]
MLKKKKRYSPIVTFIFLTFFTIVLSGILSLLNVQTEYSTVNLATNELVNNVIEVNNLLSVEGIKHIISTATSGFVKFTPLATLIIILIGIGVLEKSGFLKTACTLITKNSKKNTLTFMLIFFSLLFSIVGDIGFVVMLPIGALLFKYGRRNPLGGIIASFAGLSFGTGINIFMSSTDSSLLSLTTLAAKTIDPKYSIGIFYSLFIMIVMILLISFIFTNITEKKIMPRLPRVEHDEEEVVITNKELRGLIIGLGVGFIYILIIAYMIIPGLPLSGGLLDNNATYYIDKLFGADSLFNQGFIFIITILFVCIGFGYGFMAKTIKNTKDVTESLAYSLDGIGSILVLIFFASLFINVFEQSNIGNVTTAFLSGIIENLQFTGIWLIILVVLVIALANLLCPNPIIKWTILSSTIVPLLMNASISPEFGQVMFSAADSLTNGITPLFTYFVVYLAFLDKYNKNEMITTIGSIKYMIPYQVYITIVWLVVLIAWYMIGIPIGIGSLPGVIYGA